MAEYDRISLQDLCLETVSSNLDLFCKAYDAVRQSTEQDQSSFVLRKMLEFLRRIYTSDLLDKLRETSIHLTENHLEFLINRYAKKLDLGKFEDFGVETMKLHLSKAADTLLEMTFPNQWTAKDMEDVLATMTNLRSIDLAFTPCTDQTLRVIRHSCPLLEELDLSCCELVTNNGLKNLFYSTLPLHTLDISCTKVDVEGEAFALSMALTLKHLRHPYVPQVLLNIHEQELRANSLERERKFELVELVFGCVSTPPSDALRVCVLKCPNVEKVNFRYEEGLRLLAKFEKLREVSLFSSGEPRWPINSFLEVKGTALTRLDLRRVSLCVAVLTNFCPNLISLSLISINFEDFQQRRLSSLHSLTSLSVEPSDTEYESERLSAVALIEASPNLEILSLRDRRHFCAETVDVILRRAGRLKQVDFSRSEVKMSFLISLIHCSPMLREIWIESCHCISQSEHDLLSEHLNQIKRKIFVL